MLSPAWLNIKGCPTDLQINVGDYLWSCGADPDRFVLRETRDWGFVQHPRHAVVDRAILDRCEIIPVQN